MNQVSERLYVAINASLRSKPGSIRVLLVVLALEGLYSLSPN